MEKQLDCTWEGGGDLNKIKNNTLRQRYVLSEIIRATYRVKVVPMHIWLLQ